MPLFATATRETKLHIFSDSAKGFKTCIIVVDSPSTSNCAGAMRGVGGSEGQKSDFIQLASKYKGPTGTSRRTETLKSL